MSINTRIKLKRDTTAGWDAARGFVPLQGEIIIYLDGRQIEKNGQLINLPTVKIGDGFAYVQDLPFIDDDTRDSLLAHIGDALMHVSSENRRFWDHKVDIDDTAETVDGRLEDETLIFSRDLIV